MYAITKEHKIILITLESGFGKGLISYFHGHI